jgi:hypothetical protein
MARSDTESREKESEKLWFFCVLVPNETRKEKLNERKVDLGMRWDLLLCGKKVLQFSAESSAQSLLLLHEHTVKVVAVKIGRIRDVVRLSPPAVFSLPAACQPIILSSSLRNR